MPAMMTKEISILRRRRRRCARTSCRRAAIRGDRTTLSCVRTIRNLLELPDQLQFGLELDPRILAYHPLDLAEQGIDVVRIRIVVGDDEVGVDLRDARAADPHLLAADLLDQPGRVIPCWILEDASP